MSQKCDSNCDNSNHPSDKNLGNKPQSYNYNEGHEEEITFNYDKSQNTTKYNSRIEATQESTDDVSQNQDMIIEESVDSQPLTCYQKRNISNEHSLQTNADYTQDSEILTQATEYANKSRQRIRESLSDLIYTNESNNDPVLQHLRMIDPITGTASSSTSGNYANSTKSNRPSPSPKINSRIYIPTNHTLQSMGKNTVILIRMKNEDAHKTISNPMLINKLIKESKFQMLNIKDIRPNFSKNLIAIEAYNQLTTEQINELTKITELDTYEVSCEIPNYDKYKLGVIHPISEDMCLDELKIQIMEDNDIEIVKINRMKKKVDDVLTNTKSVKLTIKGSKMPETIKISYMKYHVRPYISEPLQCYKCQRLGHTSKSCKAKVPRCMVCSGPHDKENCISGTRKYCANCHGEHTANSKYCEIIKQAYKLERMKATQNIDHNTARNKMYQNQSNNLSPLISQIPDTPQFKSNPSYASMLKRREEPLSEDNYPKYPNYERKEFKHAETQTENDGNNIRYNRDNEDFLKQLRNFMLDLLSINLMEESKQAKLSLADNAIKNNFGVDLRKGSNDESAIDKTQFNEEENNKRKRMHYTSKADGPSTVLDTTQESEYVISDAESIWETVEKKQTKRKLRSDSSNKKKLKANKTSSSKSKQ